MCVQDLWDECGEGLSGSEQKPLFKAEQEAEKALGYLEGKWEQLARYRLPLFTIYF